MTTRTRTGSLGLDRISLRLFIRTAADRTLLVIAHVELCLQVARERRQLRAFDARALKDLGLSRVDALREANRGFWDVPGHRRNRLTRRSITYRLGSGSVPLVRQ